MHITTLADLRALYEPARERSVLKELPALDGHAMQFIGLSPLVVLSSGSAGGTMDASPRGGARCGRDAARPNGQPRAPRHGI